MSSRSAANSDSAWNKLSNAVLHVIWGQGGHSGLFWRWSIFPQKMNLSKMFFLPRHLIAIKKSCASGDLCSMSNPGRWCCVNIAPKRKPTRSKLNVKTVPQLQSILKMLSNALRQSTWRHLDHGGVFQLNDLRVRQLPVGKVQCWMFLMFKTH